MGHEIISRQEAAQNNFKRYFTGAPCKHGHIAQRYTRSTICCECDKLYKKTNQNAIEGNRRRAREWARNPENKPTIAKRNRKWLEKNRHVRHAFTKIYIKREEVKNKKRIWENIRRSRKLSNGGFFDADDIKAIFHKQAGLCVYCRVDISEKYHIDHIMPVVLGGTSWPENLQLLCPHCNYSKRDKHPDQFHKEIGYGT